MLVGIGHVSRVGKDVAANALSRDLGFQRRAFATKLKELAIHADPLVTTQVASANIGVGRGRMEWVVKGMGWEEAKNVYPEVRTFLENLGYGARQVFGEDFWVRMAVEGIRGDENVVFSDMRHHNEVDAVKSFGGKVIRIDRPGRTPTQRSELPLASFDGWDAVIPNTGTVQDLETAVVNQVKEWMS